LRLVRLLLVLPGKLANDPLQVRHNQRSIFCLNPARGEKRTEKEIKKKLIKKIKIK
tara:strand:- start:764 stop:931 length:168 start_codon:yes stop_codon:yes gene_type:complete